jgi:HEPN domain-containing protein
MTFLRRLIARCRGAGRECTRADGYSEAELLRFAYDHLASAEVLFERSPSCYDSAGCLAHASVELILKAALLHFDNGFPAIHDLRRLRGRLQRSVPELVFSAEERGLLNKVNRWYPLRYPRPGGSEPIGGAEFTVIKALAFRLLELLPDEVRAEFRSALEKGDRVLVRYPKSGSGAA